MFGLSNPFQNGMTWPGSTNDQGKGLDAGQVLTGEDWALELTTKKLAATSLLSTENFIQISPSVQKLFMNFQNTDRPTDGQQNISSVTLFHQNFAIFAHFKLE